MAHVDPVLYRTPIIDQKTGLMSREWVRFFQQIAVVFSGPILAADNLSDLPNPSAARVNIGAAKSGANADITSLSGLTTPLPISEGGTGTTTPAAALAALGGASVASVPTDTSQLTNGAGFVTATTAPVRSVQGRTGNVTLTRADISAAAAGANSDITSLTGLTTPLAVSEGGTGSGTASGARSNLGAAASGANSDITSLSTLGSSSYLTANATWQEFRWIAIAGANQAADTVALQVNARASSGGTDSWTSVFVIPISGTLTLAGTQLKNGNWVGFFEATNAFLSQRIYTDGAGQFVLDSAATANVFVPALKASTAGGLTISQPQLLSFGTNWASYTPTMTASGSMTLSSIVYNDAQYLRVGPLVFFKLNVTFNTGGTADVQLTFSLPVPFVGGMSTATAQLHTPTAPWTPAWCSVDAASNMRLKQAGEGAFPLGTGLSCMIEGFYRCA